MKMAIFWIFFALMVEAASTSETSVNFYQTTRRKNPEDGHLLTCDGRNLQLALRLHCIGVLLCVHGQVNDSHSMCLLL
jgi:hypothetical protein